MSASMPYPGAPVRPERNEVGGLVFDDPYQWMEDDDGEGVAEWQRAQDELARSYVHGWPHYDRLAARVGELVEQMDARNLVVPMRCGPRWFRGRIPEGRDLMVLETADDVTGPWRTVIDLNELSSDGAPLRMSPQPSPDGSLLAYSLDASGRELPVLKVIEIDTGKVLLDGVPQQRPGLVTWLPDGSGFFYMANESTDPRAPLRWRVFFHRLGQPPPTEPEPIDIPHMFAMPKISRDGRWALIQVDHLRPRPHYLARLETHPAQRPGTHREEASTKTENDHPHGHPADHPNRHPASGRLGVGDSAGGGPEGLRAERPAESPSADRPHQPQDEQPGVSWQWREFITDSDHLYKGVIVGDSYVAVTTAGAARGRLVRIPLDSPGDPATWTELIPGGDTVLTGVTLVGDRLVLGELVDTVSRVRILDLDGKELGEVPLPGPGSVSSVAQGVIALGVMDQVIGCEDAITFGYTSYTQSPTVYHYALETGVLTRLQGAGHTLPGLVTSRVWATSADGTRVPCTLVHRADLDRSRPQPMLLHAYGGFNIAELASYLGPLAAFVEAGGVYAHAHVRGGGEFGLQWWEGGRLHTKQNSFDDLYAVAEQLIADGVTTPDRLAVQGASNGGLLAAVAVTQRPDLWRAAVCTAPKLDLMRVVRDPVGTAATLPEYGNPNNPADAPVLMAYSPYHHVEPDTAYPAILLDAGANDPRCPVWHSRKFAARAQAATTSSHPVLLRVWSGAGHGGTGWSTIVQQQTYWLAFVMHELGLTPLPPDHTTG
ncbi:prolyl oligopeptidase family serine peptidase [Nonomuraea sp. KM90]|uniref:prolyl oligopeptidase family serine peptidase n=1 Tax=Nonomuraea sp. KM90 TaxID=3457428 RepID=UPI003FCE0E63